MKAAHKALKWGRVPLLDTRDEKHEDRVTIDGTVTLFESGDVVIRDRWFRGNWFGLFGSDAIDYEFPGGHAYREKGSNRLVIRTVGPDRRMLIFEYRRICLVIASAWYQVVCRVS